MHSAQHDKLTCRYMRFASARTKCCCVGPHIHQLTQRMRWSASPHYEAGTMACLHFAPTLFTLFSDGCHTSAPEFLRGTCDRPSILDCHTALR